MVAKILALRLKGVIGNLISPNQGAFLEERWIAENTLVAQEVMHKIKNHKGSNGLMAFKVDLRKAYDCVEWQFLQKAILCWGFSEHFVGLIFSCLEIVKYSLLINGNIVGNITLEEGYCRATYSLPTFSCCVLNLFHVFLQRRKPQATFMELRFARMLPLYLTFCTQMIFWFFGGQK